MENHSNYYRHSGKVHPSYVLFLALGIIGIAMLSFIYSIIMYYNPSAYLGFLVTGGYGFLSGIIAAQLAKRGKVRNMLVGTFSLLVYFAVFVYVHFAAYAAVVFRGDVRLIDFRLFLELFLEPPLLFEAYQYYIVPQGAWTLGSSESAVSGALLVAIWAAEHLIILLSSFFICRNSLSSPYFEETGHWGKEETCSFKWQYQPKENFPQLKSALEQGNIDYFRSLKAATILDDHYCQVSYYYDPVEKLNTRYMSVKNIQVITDKKGKNSEKEEKFIVNLSVSATFIAELENIANEETPLN